MREGCGENYCSYDLEDSSFMVFSAVIKNPYYLFYDAVPLHHICSLRTWIALRPVYIYTPIHNFF